MGVSCKDIANQLEGASNGQIWDNLNDNHGVIHCSSQNRMTICEQLLM